MEKADLSCIKIWGTGDTATNIKDLAHRARHIPGKCAKQTRSVTSTDVDIASIWSNAQS